MVISERKMKEKFEQEGWTVYRNGWPDFLLEKSGQVRLVEIKGAYKRGVQQRLSKDQVRMHAVLTQFTGTKVEVLVEEYELTQADKDALQRIERRKEKAAARITKREAALQLKNYAAYRAIKPR